MKKLIENLIFGVAIFLITFGVTYYLRYFLELDEGGLFSLAFTIDLIIIVLYMRMQTQGKELKEVKNPLKGLNLPSALIISILLGASFLALWLSVRRIGLFVKNYLLMPEGFFYNHYDVFDLVSYILATRLTFTVYETVKMTMQKKPRKPESAKIKKYSILKGLTSITIQAILIGIITLLPNYSNPTLLNHIGGENIMGAIGFVSILLSLAITLVLLIVAKNRISKKEKRAHQSTLLI